MTYTPNDNWWNEALDGVGAVALWVSAHTADPGTTGTNEVTGGSPAYARKAIAWAAASAGSMSKTATDPVLDIPASTTVTHIGLWSAMSAGTFYGSFAVTNETFGAQGTYTVDTATLAKP